MEQLQYDPYVITKGYKLDFKSALQRYFRQWKWFVVSGVLSVAIALTYAVRLPAIYQIQASLIINDEKKGSFEERILKEQQVLVPKKVVENEIEVLKSTSLLTKAAERLDLNILYYHLSGLGTRKIVEVPPVQLQLVKPAEEIYKTPLRIDFINRKTVSLNNKPYPVNQVITTPYGQLRLKATYPLRPLLFPLILEVQPRTEVVKQYLKSLRVEPTSKTSTVLVLSLEDVSPERGMALLNQLIREYNFTTIEEKNRIAANTLKFIESRLNLIAKDLATIEKDVESYKSSEGITDLSTQAETLLATVKDNDAQRNKVDLQLTALQTMESYIQQKAGDRGTSPNTLGLDDPVLLNLVSKLNDLELQRDNLSGTVNEKNPLLRMQDSQIASVKASIRENVQTLRRTLTDTRNHLSAVNQRIEGRIQQMPTKDRVLLTITRQQKIKNDLYTYLLQKREEAALSYASTVSDSRVIDEPHCDRIPVKPRKSYVVLVGALLGLLFPVGILFARDLVNDRLVRRSDLERATRVPILGEVAQNPGSKTVTLLPLNRSFIGEQIRMLRTGVQQLGRTKANAQTVLLTSSVSGEGKSFISTNLGASLSVANYPTVVLEMDLRNPQIHGALRIENTLGITDYLLGYVSLDDILKPVPCLENYWIITRGSPVANPSELLLSPRLGLLIQHLRERFSYILIDSSPVSLVTDAELIAAFADLTLFIVRYEVTPRASLRSLDSFNQNQRFPNLSVVVNGAPPSPSYYRYSATQQNVLLKA